MQKLQKEKCSTCDFCKSLITPTINLLALKLIQQLQFFVSTRTAFMMQFIDSL